MGKFDGVLLASDFDNTLLNTETARKTGSDVPKVSEKNRAALQYFMDQGGRFAVATGRALPAFIRFAPQVPMNAPCVLCNGAALYDFQESTYLETILLGEEILHRGQEVLDRFPTVAVEAYHVENVIHAIRPNEHTRSHQHVTHVSVEETPSLLDVPLPLGKIMFEADTPVLQEVIAWLEAQPWANEYEIFCSNPVLMEVTARGANKGGMVLRLAERLGISRQHIYCIGDEVNDLSMLQVAAQAFAPGNCIQSVRDCVARVVSDCEHDALADVVAILDEMYR